MLPWQIAMFSGSWAPTQFPGITGWGDANDLSGQSDGTDVTTWTNRTGASGDWDQRASGNLPDKETVNGYLAVDYLASNSESMDNATTLATMIGDTGLCAVVLELTGTPSSSAGDFYNNNAVIADASGYWAIAGVNDSGTTPGVRFGIYDGASKNRFVAATTGARHVALMYRTSGSVLTASVDGGTETTLSSVGAPQVQTGVMRLGVNYTLGTYFNGKIYEIVTSTQNGASGDRDKLLSYLINKWGI